LQTIQEREMLEKEEEQRAQQEKMRLEQRKVGPYPDLCALGAATQPCILFPVRCRTVVMQAARLAPLARLRESGGWLP